MSLPNVTNYLKNISKSIAYSSVHIISEGLPTLSAYATNEDNKELAKSIYSSVKDYKNTYTKAKTAVQGSILYKAGDLAVKNILEDLQTGKFYNKERMNSLEEALGESTFGSFDDMDIDFSGDSDSDTDITAGDKLVAASGQVYAMKAAEMVSQTQARSTDAIIKNQRAGTQLLYAQNTQLLGGIKEIAFLGTQNNNTMLNLMQIQKTATENSKLFYEEYGKVFKESNAILKEMLEMQRAMYKDTKEANKKDRARHVRIGYDDVITGDGVLDIKSYLGNIKANAKREFSNQTGGILDLLTSFGGGDLINSMVASPLSAISNAIVKTLIPAVTKKAAEGLDKTLSGLSSSILARFNAMANEDNTPAAQVIGKIFGIKTAVKSSLDTSKYNKNAVPFDGVVRKTIIDVIPGYLRKIESALTGEQERVFDNVKGKWSTMREVRKEYDDMRKSSRNSANYELLDEIRKVVHPTNNKYGHSGAMQSTKEDNKAFTDALEKMLNHIYDKDGNFKYDVENSYETGIDADLYKQIADMIVNKNNPGMKRARMRHAGNVMSSKAQLNKRMEDIEDTGTSLLLQLFNRSTDINKLKIPLYEEAPKAFGGKLELKEQKDELGRNIFFYLRNMYTELRTINGNGGTGGGSDRGAFIPEGLTPIEDIHKQTAKERYTQGLNSKRTAYSEEVIKHTKLGGKLYDISDSKGNIRIDRASVEQLELIARLEDEHKSHGYVADYLYGNTTKLDKLNRTKKESGEETITQAKFTDRIKAAANIGEKLAVIQDQINHVTSAPGKMAARVMDRAESSIYDFFYGDETGTKDGKNKIKGFMNLMSMKLNVTFNDIADKLDKKIFGPIKDKLGVKDMSELLDKIGVTKVIDGIKDRLLGEADADGKRTGGILSNIGAEIKHVFGTAAGYVGNAISTVFDPITRRVKDALANKPTKQEESVFDPEGNLLYSSTGDVTKAAVVKRPSFMDKVNYKVNPKQALENDKHLISSHILGTNNYHAFVTGDNFWETYITSFVDRLYSDTNTKEDIIEMRDEYIKLLIPRLSVDNPDVVGVIIRAFNRIAEATKIKTTKALPIMPKKLTEEEELVKNTRLARGVNKGNATKARNKAEAAKPKIAKTGAEKALNPTGTPETLKLAEELNSILEFDGSRNGSYVEELSNMLGSMVGENGEIRLKDITAKEIYDASSTNSRLSSFNKFFKDYMTDTYNNKDININDVIAKRSLSDITKGDNKGSGNFSIMGKVHSVLTDILSVMKSVVHSDKVDVRLTKTYRGANTSATSITSRRGSGRESETEGDSTGDSDGELHSSAFGNVFKHNTTSALSKGELYGRNGLFAKVPNTGVYDVKSGTTIYPTDKDKTIELANEQNAISKYLNKGKLPTTNADAKNSTSREIDGKIWTLEEDHKWHRETVDKDGNKHVYTLDEGLLDKTYHTAASGVNQVLTGLGFNPMSKDGSIRTLDKATALVEKFAPKMTANGLLGAAIGLLSGNPLLGAAIGASAGYVSASDNAKNKLFGEQERDEAGDPTGDRKGGVVSRETQDIIKKYLPNMSKYGISGAVLSLVTPLGLAGGLAVGASLGWAKSNERISEALFGELDKPKTGLLSKEFRDRITDAIPSIGIGAIGTMILGPFGLLGNMALGSGLGLLSTTEGFKSALFGEQSTNEDGVTTRDGGLVGAIKQSVVDPLKDFAKGFGERAENFVIKDLIDPLKEGIRPIAKELGLIAKGTLLALPNMIKKMFESTFGRPLAALVRDRFLNPVGRAVGSFGRGAGAIGKGVISAPFKAVRGIGRSLESKHIRKGDASYLSAEERLAYRGDHGIRGKLSNLPIIGNSVFGSLGFNPTGYRDEYKGIDKTLAGIEDPEQLKSILDNMTQLTKGKGYYKDLNRKTGRGIMKVLATKFPSSVMGRIQRAMKSGNIKAVSTIIHSPKTKLLPGVTLDKAERDELVKQATDAIISIQENTNKGNVDKGKRTQLFETLGDMGFAGINEGNIKKVRSLVKTEYDIKKGISLDGRSEEEKQGATISDPIVSNATSNADRIVSVLEHGLSDLHDVSVMALPEGRRLKYLKKRATKYGPKDIVKETNADKPDEELDNVDETEDPNILHTRRPKLGLRGKVSRKMYSIKEAINRNAVNTLNKRYADDDSVKYEYDPDSNAVRKFVMNKNGAWVQPPGKAKSDADNNEKAKEKSKIAAFAGKLSLGLKDILGIGKKDDTGERKDGLLHKLLGGFGKLLKIGVVGATGVALTGHAAGAVKDTIIPKIKSVWTETVFPFLSDHFGVIGEKIGGVVQGIANFVSDVPNKIKNLVTTLGAWFGGKEPFEGSGFPSVFEDHIFPFYMDGFHKFATVFLPPLVKVFVSTLPTIAKGIVSGTWQAVQSLIDKDIHPSFDVDKINTDGDTEVYKPNGGLNDIDPVSGGVKWWSGTSNALSDLINFNKNSSISGANGKTVEKRLEDKKGAQTKVNTAKTTAAKKAAIDASIENAREIGPNGQAQYNANYMPTDSRGNHYDKDGNISNDNSRNTFDPFSGAVSTSDRLFKAVAKQLLGGNRGLNPFNLLKLVGSGTSLIPGVGKFLGGPMQGIGKVGDKVLRKLPDLTKGMVDGDNLGSIYGKVGEKLAKVKAKNIATLGTNIAESKFADMGEKAAKEAAEKAAKEAAKKAAGDAVGDVASRSLLPKMGKLITEGITKLFSSTVVLREIGSAMKAAGKKTGKEIVEKTAKEAGEVLIRKLFNAVGQGIAKASSAVLAKLAATVISPVIATIAFTVYDFVTGVTNAKSILGISKDQDVSFFERLVCGLLKTINNAFIFGGIIPEDMIMDFLIDTIAPMCSYDTTELNARRDEAKKVVDEYNKATGLEYSVEEYNNKDKLSTKIKNKMSGFIKFSDPNGGTGPNSSDARASSIMVDTTTSTGNKTGLVPYAHSKGTNRPGDKYSGSARGKYGLGRVYQNDPRYANTRFNKSNDSIYQTVGDSGCGPAAAVNAINYAYGTGANNTLDNAVNVALKGGYKERNGGTEPAFFDSYFRQNGLQAQRLHGSTAIKNSIATGSPVVMMGTDNNAGYNTPYGPSPHYVVGKGFDNKGNILVDDPESRYGTSRYNPSRVFRNTKLAISASKYGRGPALNTDPRDLNNIKTTVPSNTMSSTYVPKYKAPFSVGADMSNLHASNLFRLSNKDKCKLGFTLIPVADKQYDQIYDKPEVDSRFAEAIRNAFTRIGKPKSSGDGMSVKSICSTFFSFSLSSFQKFANDIAPYAALSIDELRKTDSSLYRKFKSYVYDTSGINLESSYVSAHKSVGEICNGYLGLRFKGDGSIDDYASTGSEYIARGEVLDDTYNTDLSNSYGDTTMYENSGDAPSAKDSIFSVMTSAFRSMFNFTDKETGEKRNALDIFGINFGSKPNPVGGGGNAAFAPGGLSPQQQAVRESINSIMGKNDYDQGRRYEVGATLDGAPMGYGDCSSTVQWALKKGANVDPGGNTSAQIQAANGKWVDGPYEMGKDGKPNIGSLALGDLMFYGSNKSNYPKKVSHVAMYWGDGKRVGHGSGMGPVVSGYTVKASSQQYLGSKRFLPVGDISGPTKAAGGNIEQNKRTIWSFLINKGYSGIAASGIMGNIEQECGYNHALKEKGGKGIGICQWTSAGRRDAFLAAVPDWETNLGGQLDFFWREINSSYKGVLPGELNKCTTVEQATKVFHDIYERSGDYSRPGGIQNRYNYANKAYGQFGSKGNNYGAGSMNRYKQTANALTAKYGKASGLSNIVRNGEVTSEFNDPTRRQHNGIDIAGSNGQPIISPTNGIVYRSEYNDTNGNMVVVESNDGYLYTFCHLKSTKLKVGDRVSIGSIIGTMGSTGDSLGEHVHYQVTNPKGQFINPATGKNIEPTTVNRAIGGSDGLDYTKLIHIIIELLGTISGNTAKFASALSLLSEKTGIDTSGIDVSTDTKALNKIKDRLKALDNSTGKSSDLGTSMMGSDVDYLVKVMSTIAKD